MRNDKYTLNAPTSAAAGTPFPAKDMRHKTVQISGTFVATCRLQGTIDGATWVDLTADITAPGLHNLVDAAAVEWALHQVRVNVTAYTSGAIVATLAGFGRSE
jgi:hypothetical protein